MSENFAPDEDKFPENLETIVSMSFQYDKLQQTLKFIIELLKKHDKAITLSNNKLNSVLPEILNLHSFNENIEKKTADFEKSYIKTSRQIEELKNNLEARGDTVETLKYILNKITDHDSFILQQKKQSQELKQNSQLEERLNLLENSYNKLKEKYKKNIKKKINSTRNTKKTSLIQPGLVKIPIELTVPEEKPQFGMNLTQISTEKNKDPLTSSIDPSLQYKDENIFRQSIESIEISEKADLFNPSQKTDQIFPIIPEDIQQIFIRVKKIEASIEDLAKKSDIQNSLTKLESMYKFIEGIIDSCEPVTIRNRNEILKLVRNLKNLESELNNKLSTEEFDAIRALVIALASGTSKFDVSSLIPTKDINTIRSLEKKVNQLETSISDIVKIYPESVEEVILKLRRIEQSLEFKINNSQLQELRGSLDKVWAKIKDLSENIEKTEISKNDKTFEASAFNTIKRKIANFEGIIRDLKIPLGMDLTHVWNETKRFAEMIKTAVSALETIKNSENSWVQDLNIKIDRKADKEELEILEEKIKLQEKDNVDKLSYQYADKFEMQKGLRRLEKMVKNAEFAKTNTEGDDAMIAKKPLGGWSCASCDKKLEGLAGKVLRTSWNKIPARDNSEKMIKMGPGFSKMLALMQDETARSTVDNVLPLLKGAKRSITPQP